MTSPINFPTISPPQVVRPESTFSDFAQLMVAIAQHRQQLSVRKQELALDKERTAASVAEAGQRTAASKAEEARKKREAEIKEQMLEAESIVANELPGILTAPGDFAQNAEAARVRLIQSNKQLAPFINDAFNEQLKRTTDARAAIAQRRTAEVTATVAEGTAAADIAKAKTDAERAEVELTIARVNKALMDDTAKFGQRGQLMLGYMSGGATAGEAARLAGMRLPPDVPADYRLLDPSAGAESQRLSGFASTMDAANQTLASLKDPGLNDFAFAQLASGSTVVEILTSRVISDEQKQAISAYALYIQPLNRLMAGGNASDKDQALARRSVVTKRTDGPKTREQKAMLRAVLPEVLRPFTPGQTDPADALNAIVERARARGVPQELLAPFVGMARRAQRTGAGLRNQQSRTAAPRDALDPAIADIFNPRKP